MVTCEEIGVTPPLAPEAHRDVVNRAIFECFKWDPQFEDTCVLAPFALTLSRQTWDTLADLAQRLAAETMAIEQELVSRPDLLRQLGLPRAIVRALSCGRPAAPGIARVMRFDFHLTTEGWRVSEVNCDVPGGFVESSGFAQLMAEQYDGLKLTGNPAAAVARNVAEALSPGAVVALAHATAYTDDRQVMLYLARHIESLGLRACLTGPDQIQWVNGNPTVLGCGAIDAILRFFPAEWLPNLGSASKWSGFFTDSAIRQCNPGTGLVVQSKRLPLVWDRLSACSETWRTLLPETRDPREVGWGLDPRWIVKPALGRVGSDIGMSGVTTAKEWKPIRRSVRWFPGHWVAQRRFEPLPVETPHGEQFPCIGVYTVDGRPAGIYGRIAPRPLIDHRARDVAVLFSKDI